MMKAALSIYYWKNAEGDIQIISDIQRRVWSPEASLLFKTQILILSEIISHVKEQH